jgi:hypothetical protein
MDVGRQSSGLKKIRAGLTGPGSPAHRLVANQVRLHLFVLAYNLGNFLRRLGLPKAIKDWSLLSLQVKSIKIGGRIVHHARQIVFQLTKVAVSRDLFATILERISWLSLAPGWSASGGRTHRGIQMEKIGEVFSFFVWRATFGLLNRCFRVSGLKLPGALGYLMGLRLPRNAGILRTVPAWYKEICR